MTNGFHIEWPHPPPTVLMLFLRVYLLPFPQKISKYDYAFSPRFWGGKGPLFGRNISHFLIYTPPNTVSGVRGHDVVQNSRFSVYPRLCNCTVLQTVEYSGNPQFATFVLVGNYNDKTAAEFFTEMPRGLRKIYNP